jgi:hypothetical protein
MIDGLRRREGRWCVDSRVGEKERIRGEVVVGTGVGRDKGLSTEMKGIGERGVYFRRGASNELVPVL